MTDAKKGVKKSAEHLPKFTEDQESTNGRVEDVNLQSSLIFDIETPEKRPKSPSSIATEFKASWKKKGKGRKKR